RADPVLFERIEKAFETAIADAVVGAAYVGDASTAHSQQMLGCEFSSGVVIRTDKVRAQVFEGAVQQDNGGLSLLYFAERLGLRLAGGDDQRIQAVRQHMLDLLLLEF